MSEPLVSFRRVTRRYGNVLAVEDLNLGIDPGETVALLGPNGAGKTTTVEMMVGLLGPQEGDVLLLGAAPDVAVARGAVGAMLQSSGLPSRTTVHELIELARSLYPRPLPLEEAFALCELEPVAERRVEDLSGGQQQRVRLALAVAGRPKLLVLDEPTAAMDVHARRVFWSRARDYVAERGSVVFTTHRLEEAEGAADRVVVLSKGRVVADAPPEVLKARMSLASKVRFKVGGIGADVLEGLPGVDGIEVAGGLVTLHTFDPDRTLRALHAWVPKLDALEVTRGRLEEAFAALTGEEGA